MKRLEGEGEPFPPPNLPLSPPKAFGLIESLISDRGMGRARDGRIGTYGVVCEEDNNILNGYGVFLRSSGKEE